MAKFYKLLAIGCWLLAASCQEGRDAGDLLGQWKLMDKEDMYVSFSGTITQFRKNNGQAVFAKFQHVGDSLFIQCSSIYQEKSDTPEDIECLPMLTREDIGKKKKHNPVGG